MALAFQTQHDPLTGLLTRAAFIERIRQALAEVPATPQAVTRLELDQLSRVNESVGYELGDELLRAVAARLATAVPDEVALARIASDEFGVIAPGDEEATLRSADRLLAALDRPFIIGGRAIHLTAVVGAARSPQHGTDAATLMRRAGAARERAKRSGSPMALCALEDERVGIGLAEVEEFREAIERGELVLHYQPQVEGDLLVPIGVEALVRWAHPREGLLLHAAFLPLVRENGFGRMLTRWVLKGAVAQRRAWRMAGSAVSVAVNLTMDDAQDPALADHIAALLTELEHEHDPGTDDRAPGHPAPVRVAPLGRRLGRSVRRPLARAAHVPSGCRRWSIVFGIERWAVILNACHRARSTLTS